MSRAGSEQDDAVWLTEHYFTGEGVYNDALRFAAALTMRTTRVHIGFAVVQMPLHHPIRPATQLALLDNLSKGRIDVGIAKGTVYSEYKFVGHGPRSGDSRERMAFSWRAGHAQSVDRPRCRRV